MFFDKILLFNYAKQYKEIIFLFKIKNLKQILASILRQNSLKQIW